VSFVARHGLWSDDQRAAAREMAKDLRAGAVEVVRFVFADQHGVTRGKTLVAAEALSLLEEGVSLTSTLLLKDTAHRTAYPIFSAGGGHGIPEMQGAADMLIVPDPSTFRILPWAPSSGWVLCDPYFHDGRPVPFGTFLPVLSNRSNGAVSLFAPGWRWSSTCFVPLIRTWRRPTPGNREPRLRRSCCRMAINI